MAYYHGRAIRHEGPGVDREVVASPRRGRGLSTDCARMADAMIDAWQADAGGESDHAGHWPGGHQVTDDRGRDEGL